VQGVATIEMSTDASIARRRLRRNTSIWLRPALALLLAVTAGIGTSHAHAAGSDSRPVLAFYYTWYSPSTWCLCRMSDLPTIRYDSHAVTTIDRHIAWASDAGITGFITSWWGPGSSSDHDFATLLSRSSLLEQTTNRRFSSTIYLESDAPALTTESNIVAALRYVLARYGADPHFLHWHGKPVIFIWDPLGGGRTLATWADVRARVDPHDQTIWSAEGTDPALLGVFDGIHLFSAGYWGILAGNMAAVDQGFRAKVDAYNQAHGTRKIWAAGVQPGYDDRRVPGRQNTYVVPRDGGATYRTSWTAAMASNPDWITISTFNEWLEGGMIEPSIHYGGPYLTLTEHFIRQWRASA